MKTVTMCGSMRFEREMQSIAFRLEAMDNYNVLQCVYNIDKLDISQEEAASLARGHFKKIEMSDAIYVVDIDGYIGNQVAGEIEYAESLGKEVIYHSKYASTEA